MKKKKKVNNLTFIILGAVVLFVVGGLIGSSITGNAVKGQGWLGGLFGGWEDTPGFEVTVSSSMDLKFEIEDFSEEVDTMEMYILSNFETMGIDELRIAVLMQSSLLKQNTEILAKLQALNGGEELQEAHGDGFRYGPDDDACDECVNGCVDAHVQDPDGMADCVDGCCGGSCSC